MDTATALQPTTAPSVAVPDTTPLSAADRCDRCSAGAYVRATMPDASSLLFCAHHAHEHRAALLLAGASLHDETARLTVRRESSANA